LDVREGLTVTSKRGRFTMPACIGGPLMKSRYKLSCAVAAILTGCAGAAFAADPAATPAAADASASATGVEEIVVTAQRRSENLQSVPETVQAFGSQQLQQLNVTNLSSLLQYTPNVTFANNGPGQGNIFMRGLSAGFAGNQSSATIAPFPNVALYLDDMSMTFPSRNVDVYAADLERVEVLEGPQGTLFGGGAEAGALRYITNKPKLNTFEASAEAQYGFTSGGAENENAHFMINIPVIDDKLAVRLVFYDDHQGGYIDNVESSFDRSNADLGNAYFKIKPNATTGLCPNGLPQNNPGNGGYCALPASQAPAANNASVAGPNQNPATYQGLRAEILYKINEDWNVLITQSLQNLDAEGISAEEPYGSDFQALQPLQETSFSPAYDKDDWESTAWTVNGKVGDLRLVYTGGYMVRHINQQMDYSNYSRSAGGMYYECTGPGTGFGKTAPTQCYSPVSYWDDKVKNTHFTQEFRVSTPDTWRLRGIAGVYYEQFRIYDDMNFNYKTIPSCTAANYTLYEANPANVCVGDVAPAPGATTNDPGVRSDATAFGEDTQRGYNQEAAFISADFDIIPHVLTITGGTRYFQYNEFEVGSQYETGTNCVGVPNAVGCTADDTNIDSHKDHVTYHGFKSRAGVNWHINDRTLAYFLWSQGFRPGAFNRSFNDVAPIQTSSGAIVEQYQKPNSYAPDTLTNFEIGLKTELFDRRLLVDLSAYDMNWDNVQLLFFNPAAGLGNTTFGVNGPNYNVKGIEAQVVAKLMPGLTAQGSASYNHEVQTSSPCLLSNIASSPTNGQCITQVYSSQLGTNVAFQNPFGANGTTPAFAPAFQGNIRVRYEWAIGNYKAYVTASGQYTGSMYNQPATYTSGVGVIIPGTTLLRYYQPGYATADVSAGVAKDNWYVEVYSNNLFDSHSSVFTSSAQFIESMVPIRPRIIMLKVGAHF
jgi:outer membrane receptor protein involved in Fe transport